jgi:hypothetical protein
VRVVAARHHVGAGDDRPDSELGQRAGGAEQLVEQVLGLAGVPAVRVDGDDHYFVRTQIGFV